LAQGDRFGQRISMALIALPVRYIAHCPILPILPANSGQIDKFAGSDTIMDTKVDRVIVPVCPNRSETNQTEINSRWGTNCSPWYLCDPRSLEETRQRLGKNSVPQRLHKGTKVRRPSFSCEEHQRQADS
jgi:hypothetical protein